eukprot:426811-Prymnesium_polylepis.1
MLLLLVATSSYAPTCAGPRAAARGGVASVRAVLSEEVDESVGRPVIEWYPGHIAKAERLMSEVLGMVDVVVELRDARAPVATTHPMLPTWIGSRGRVLVINRVDSVSQSAIAQWERELRAQGEEPHF